MTNKNKWLEFNDFKYDKMFQNRLLTHNYFKNWLRTHKVNSALEIGGGVSNHKELFKDYHNIEINETIKNPWTSTGDYLNYEPEKKYDIVFSHAVIDHSEKPNEFILKSIKEAKKYVFHSIYRGWTRASRTHEPPIIDKDDYLYNNLSYFELSRILEPFDHELFQLENKNVILIVKH